MPKQKTKEIVIDSKNTQEKLKRRTFKLKSNDTHGGQVNRYSMFNFNNPNDFTKKENRANTKRNSISYISTK